MHTAERAHRAATAPIAQAHSMAPSLAFQRRQPTRLRPATLCSATLATVTTASATMATPPVRRALGCLAAVVLLFTAPPPTDAMDLAFCGITQNPSGQSMPFPNVSTTYQAKLDVSLYNDRSTLFVEEYYDVGSKMGAMIVTGYFNPGIRTHFISDGRTNEFFTIYDLDNRYDKADNCQVDPLNGGVFSFPAYKKGTYTANSDDFMSSGAILLMGQSSQLTTYVGNDRVNGVYANVWKSCLYKPSGDVTVKVTYYFSAKVADATTSALYPIRIDIESNQQPVAMKRTFSYAYFSDQLLLDDYQVTELFETPEGAVCPNRVETAPLPAVPSAFSFRMETVDRSARTVSVTREWYDYTSKLTRIDFRMPPTNYSGETYPLRIINDYNTGLSYMINRDTDACTIGPIAGGQYDNMFDDAGRVRMRSPSEFFDFDRNSTYPYQYEGVHFARGLLADVWISRRPLPMEDGGSGPMVIWQWYFSASDWNIHANTRTETQEPVRAVLQVSQDEKPVIYNIYKFTEEEPDTSIFDTSACFLSSDSRAFEMTLSANVTQYRLDTNRKLLKYWILLSIQAYTNVSATRVQEFQFIFGTDSFTVQFLLLGPAPNATTGVYQVPLGQAGDALQRAVEGSSFVVMFSPDGQNLAQFTAKPDSLRVIRHRRRRSRFTKDDGTGGSGGGSDDDSSGMTDGGLVALLVIGTLVAGALMAFVAIQLVTRRQRRGGGGQPYQRHALDMDAQ